jgi:hypothetical protein
MFLVEAGPKFPNENQFGDKKSILNPKSQKYGLVARNIRLMLTLIDLTKPYVRYIV